MAGAPVNKAEGATTRIRPMLPAPRIPAFLLPALALAASGCSAGAAPEQAADLILTNARVYTVEEAKPWAQAVAIKEGRILAVGSAEEMDQHKGSATRVVDLKGRMLMPAFGDAHNHPIFGGLSYARCSLHKGKSVDDYRKIISGCVAKTPGTSVVYGVGWEDSLFPPNGVPRKEVLDAISTDRPLIFRSVGGHSLWLNSRALEMAGITRDTKDPPNGTIDRDPKTGEAVGGLQEAARELAYPLVPPPTQADLRNAISYNVSLFNSLGITSWRDAGLEWKPDGSSEVLDAYQAVRAEGKLNMHVAIDLKWDNARKLDQIPTLLRIADRAAALGFKAKSVKYYLDGVIPQQTAAMLTPYEGTSVKGSTQIPADVLASAVSALDAKGFQAHVHSIGDAAVRQALDAFAASRGRNGKLDARPMISHLNVIDPADQPRFGQLGAAAIFQPLWACDEPYMRLTIERIGQRRAGYIYPAGSVLRSAGMLAYGADWSVASANPMEGLEVALTRICPDAVNGKPLIASEGVTLPQAIKAYTINVAYVNRLEKETGSIAPGKSADLIVLDRNLFETPPTELAKVKVLLTLFKGKTVFGSFPG